MPDKFAVRLNKLVKTRGVDEVRFNSSYDRRNRKRTFRCYIALSDDSEFQGYSNVSAKDALDKALFTMNSGDWE